jgi:hypothetical protein
VNINAKRLLIKALIQSEFINDPVGSNKTKPKKEDVKADNDNKYQNWRNKIAGG